MSVLLIEPTDERRRLYRWKETLRWSRAFIRTCVYRILVKQTSCHWRGLNSELRAPRCARTFCEAFIARAARGARRAADWYYHAQIKAVHGAAKKRTRRASSLSSTAHRKMRGARVIIPKLV